MASFASLRTHHAPLLFALTCLTLAGGCGDDDPLNPNASGETTAETGESESESEAGDSETGGAEAESGETGDEFPECLLGEGIVLSSTILDVEFEGGLYDAPCTLGAINELGDGPLGGQTIELQLDCDDGQNPRLQVTSEPVWIPELDIGQGFRVEIADEGEWGDEVVWRLYDVGTEILLVDYRDAGQLGGAAFDVTVVSGLCEPDEYCEGEGPEGEAIPGREDVALDFSDAGETQRLLPGEAGMVGDYDLWLDVAQTDKCASIGDAQGPRFNYMAVREGL